MWTCGVDAWKKSTRLPSLRHSRPEGGGFAAGSSPADASDRNARAVVQRIRISEKRSRREGGGRTRSETGSVYGTKTRAFPLRRHRPTARGPPSVCRRTCRQTRTQSFAKIRRRTKGPATVRLTNGFIRTASEAPLPLRRSKPEVSAASAGQATFRHEKYRNRNSFAVRLRPDRQGLRAMGRPPLQGRGEPPASPWRCRINFKKNRSPRARQSPLLRSRQSSDTAPPAPRSSKQYGLGRYRETVLPPSSKRIPQLIRHRGGKKTRKAEATKTNVEKPRAHLSTRSRRDGACCRGFCGRCRAFWQPATCCRPRPRAPDGCAAPRSRDRGAA